MNAQSPRPRAFEAFPATGTRYLLGAGVGALLLVAAIAKVTDPMPAVRAATAVFRELDAPSVAPLAVAGAIGVEFWCGIQLLMGGTRRNALAVCLGLIGALSIFIVALMLIPGSPGCGCLGAGSGKSTTNEHVVGLVRNGAIAWILLSLARPSGVPTSGQPAPTVSAGPQPPSPPRGFALVELLVVIAIISVLMSLVLPALGRVRMNTTALRSIAAQRQMLVAIEAYAGDNQGGLPYLGTPGAPETPMVVNGFTLPYARYFFYLRPHWATLLFPEYVPTREFMETQRSREVLGELGWPVDQIVRSHFHMADCAFAAPAHYAGGVSREQRPEPWWFRGVGMHEVAFPSSKGLTVDRKAGIFAANDRPDSPFHDQGSVGFVDGSAAWMPWPTDTRASFTVLRPDYGGHSGQPVYQTLDGVLGRDWPTLR